MKICVINGSPKGKNSVTLQTCLYFEKCFPKHEFTFVNVGQKIKYLEKDFSEAENALNEAELVIFAYPVYTFIAPYQLHRFIELLKDKGMSFKGKYATQVSTSKHFYDITAHNYVKENALDLGFRYIDGLSADMDDLLCEKGQKQAQQFFSGVMFSVKQGIYAEGSKIKSSKPLPYVPVFADLGEKEKINEFPTVILTNAEDDDVSLHNMIADFQKAYPYKSEVINIGKFPFTGGCLGCFKCAITGKCVYKDGFDSYLREEIQTKAAIVYAFTIKDHCMGTKFKCYDDRQFCNGHRTVTTGMPIGYLVRGDYENEANLKMIVEGRSEVGGNPLCGVALDAQGIVNLAKRLTFALKTKEERPQNFYGVGGTKIFRDLIYQMRGLMQADHKFYKEHGIYDFPQNKPLKIMQMQVLGALMRNEKVQKKMGNKMNSAIVGPYQKVIDKVSKK